MAEGERKKILVFVDFDAVIRHFILSGAFTELMANHEVKFVFHADPTSTKQGIHADVASLGLANYTHFEVPRARMGAWDKLYSVTALHNHRGSRTFGLRKALMADVRGWPRSHYYHLLSLPWIYPFARSKLMADMGVYRPLLDFVDREAPDLIVHPSLLSGYFINELLQISKLRDIPLLVVMNSWDNPSAKAMNTGSPTKLAVWGPQTRDHALQYLKTPPEDVEILGAAQFEVYRAPVGQSNAELRAEFEVPEGLPCLLYAGTSKSANDSRHLSMLDDAVENGSIPKCHFIYRPHPWRGPLVDHEVSFFDLPLKHVTMDPHMRDFYRRAIAGTTKGFELADYNVTHRLLHLVAGVVSPMSTILLESGIMGKPALMFFPDPDREMAAQNFTLNVGSKMPHFEEFWGIPGIEVCSREAELPAYCARLLTMAGDPEVAHRLRTHIRRFVDLDGPSFASKLRSLVERMLSYPQEKRRPEPPKVLHG